MTRPSGSTGMAEPIDVRRLQAGGADSAILRSLYDESTGVNLIMGLFAKPIYVYGTRMYVPESYLK